jgi:hypothetical protein
MYKNFLKSWTVWFGVAQVLTAVTGYFSGHMDASTAQALFVTGLGTIGFRFKTTTGVTLN